MARSKIVLWEVDARIITTQQAPAMTLDPIATK
jgi:hypothetical protein